MLVIIVVIIVTYLECHTSLIYLWSFFCFMCWCACWARCTGLPSLAKQSLRTNPRDCPLPFFPRPWPRKLGRRSVRATRRTWPTRCGHSRPSVRHTLTSHKPDDGVLHTRLPTSPPPHLHTQCLPCPSPDFDPGETVLSALGVAMRSKLWEFTSQNIRCGGVGMRVSLCKSGSIFLRKGGWGAQVAMQGIEVLPLPLSTPACPATT